MVESFIPTTVASCACHQAAGSPRRSCRSPRARRCRVQRRFPEERAFSSRLRKGATPASPQPVDLWDGATIAVQTPTGERKTLITGGSDPRYLSTGHLLYARGGRLFVAPFDLKRLTVAGNGMPVMEGVARAILGRTSSGVAQADVSANGSIVYAPGPASPASEPPRLVIVDRAGNVTPLKVQTGFYERPRVSPDGTQLALGSEDSNGATIWIDDLSGDTSMPPPHVPG